MWNPLPIWLASRVTLSRSTDAVDASCANTGYPMTAALSKGSNQRRRSGTHRIPALCLNVGSGPPAAGTRRFSGLSPRLMTLRSVLFSCCKPLAKNCCCLGVKRYDQSGDTLQTGSNFLFLRAAFSAASKSLSVERDLGCWLSKHLPKKRSHTFTASKSKWVDRTFLQSGKGYPCIQNKNQYFMHFMNGNKIWIEGTNVCSQKESDKTLFPTMSTIKSKHWHSFTTIASPSMSAKDPYQPVQSGTLSNCFSFWLGIAHDPLPITTRPHCRTQGCG